MEVPRSFNELLSDKQANFGSLGDELRGIELGNNCLQHLGGGGGEGRGGEGRGRGRSRSYTQIGPHMGVNLT